MVDETLTQRLDGLLARSKDSAAAGRELHRMLHDGRLQGNPEVERWLTIEMAKQEFGKLRLAALNAPNDMHRKCAGLALVQQALQLPESYKRTDELARIVKTTGLHADARVEAVKALDVELNSTTGDMAKMRLMRSLLQDLDGAPDAVKEAVAEAFCECALKANENVFLVKEMVQSGKYGKVADRMGMNLVDRYLKKGNPREVEAILYEQKTPPKVAEYAGKKLVDAYLEIGGLDGEKAVNLIADNPKTPYVVAAYACAKLGRQIPKPPLRDENPTLMGMPLAAWMRKTGDEMEKARAANVTPDGGKGPGGKPKVAVRR